MNKAYLIINPSIATADIFKKIYFYRWNWIDLFEETDTSPRTFFFEEDGTNVYLREEHRSYFNAKYFYLEGEDIEEVLQTLKNDIPLLSSEDLITQLREQNDNKERGSAICQLGILWCGQPFEPQIYEVFEKVLEQEKSEVKIAALYGMAWTCWKEIIPLVKLALKDHDEEVSRIASLFLEGLSSSD